MRIAQMKTLAVALLRSGTVLGVLTVTAPFAAGADSVREACTHDAFRLCSSAIPDVAKTKACLAHNRASLSDTCQQAFGSVAGPHGGHHHHHHHRHR